MRAVKSAGKALGVVVTGWAAWRLFGPEVPRRYPMPQVRPLRVPGRSVFVGEREYFVREAGPEGADPVVLIHGWSLDAEMTYHRVVPELATRYRVVLPDLRNHGKSDWVRGRYDVADVADEVAGVLDALRLPAATIMGYSLGGMVAQELARRYPHLVKQIVLAATAARPVPTRRVLARTAFWLGRALARVSTHEGAALTEGALRHSNALEPSHRRWAHESLMRRDGELFYEAGAAAIRFDSRDWVGKLRVPVTVVIPTQDLLVPTAAQRELAALIPHADVIELTGAGHESILTRADEYLALLDKLMTAG
jgi:pimeloyl-ACP methyl ester carboxylesterase